MTPEDRLRQARKHRGQHGLILSHLGEIVEEKAMPEGVLTVITIYTDGQLAIASDADISKDKLASLLLAAAFTVAEMHHSERNEDDSTEPPPVA